MDRIHSATAKSFLIKVYMWLDFVFKAYVDIKSLEGGGSLMVGNKSNLNFCKG